GLIDGFQPDCTATGFSRWQALEEWLEPTGVRSVPRNFGNGTFGTRAELVFGAASQTFLMLEDERFRPAVFADDDVSFSDGHYSTPSGHGLGLTVDTHRFQREYSANEIVIR
ncbi:MAG TPA: hypothetical protein DDY93_14955, partial [Dehalococcoidia bacterium]|nr:hypothetical protein [Dehalococcoidia bacterium]